MRFIVQVQAACWAHGELGRPLDPSRHAVTGSHGVVSLSQSVVYLRGAGKSASSEDRRGELSRLQKARSYAQ